MMSNIPRRPFIPVIKKLLPREKTHSPITNLSEQLKWVRVINRTSNRAHAHAIERTDYPNVDSVIRQP